MRDFQLGNRLPGVLHVQLLAPGQRGEDRRFGHELGGLGAVAIAMGDTGLTEQGVAGAELAAELALGLDARLLGEFLTGVDARLVGFAVGLGAGGAVLVRVAGLAGMGHGSLLALCANRRRL